VAPRMERRVSMIFSLLILMYFVSQAAIVTRPHRHRHGLRRGHDWKFEAEAAKVSDPAENSFLSSPRGRVYPNGASGQEDEPSGCRVAVRKIPHTLILPG
jgi:hypothetical protein